MESKRYIVETCFRPGIWSHIKQTDNYDEAAASANFWDEKQDTRLIDLNNQHWYDAAMRQFDMAVARIEGERESPRRHNITYRRGI